MMPPSSIIAWTKERRRRMDEYIIRAFDSSIFLGCREWIDLWLPLNCRCNSFKNFSLWKVFRDHLLNLMWFRGWVQDSFEFIMLLEIPLKCIQVTCGFASAFDICFVHGDFFLVNWGDVSILFKSPSISSLDSGSIRLIADFISGLNCQCSTHMWNFAIY